MRGQRKRSDGDDYRRRGTLIKVILWTTVLNKRMAGWGRGTKRAEIIKNSCRQMRSDGFINYQNATEGGCACLLGKYKSGNVDSRRLVASRERKVIKSTEGKIKSSFNSHHLLNPELRYER